HTHKAATFNQRELGTDFDSFANGLRAALRQAPKVILVGEMRDRDTVRIALSAAETGHLVLSTIHTIDAGQTINRILGMFEPEEQEQIRARLADMPRWVVDLPEPVAPVTSTRPVFSRGICLMISGNFSQSSVGITVLSFRSTIE